MEEITRIKYNINEKSMDISDCERVISKLKAEINFPVNIQCQKWDGNHQTVSARAYFTADPIGDSNPSPPVIILLPERFNGGEEELTEVVKHELIHAYDHCQLKRDLTDCRQLACSEIRAAREADCRDFGKSFAAFLCRSLAPQSAYCERVQVDCVKRVSLRSTKSVFPENEAQQCIKEMFDECFKDLRSYRTSTIPEIK